MEPIYEHMVSDFVKKVPYYVPNCTKWHYYVNPDFIPNKESPLTGKHLFYSKRSQELEKAVIDEIENDFFFMGKIISAEARNRDEYVLCLYDHDDSRTAELKKSTGAIGTSGMSAGKAMRSPGKNSLMWKSLLVAAADCSRN